MTIALTNDNKLYLWGGGILIPREFNLNGEQITRLYSVESGFSGSFGFLAVNNEDKAFKLEFDNNPLNDKLELASNNFSYSIFNGNKSVEKKEKVRLIDYFGEEESTLDNCLSIDKIYYFNSSNNYIIAKMLDGKIRIIRFDVSPPLG